MAMKSGLIYTYYTPSLNDWAPEIFDISEIRLHGSLQRLKARIFDKLGLYRRVELNRQNSGEFCLVIVDGKEGGYLTFKKNDVATLREQLPDLRTTKLLSISSKNGAQQTVIDVHPWAVKHVQEAFSRLAE